MAYCILNSYKLKLDPLRIFQALQGWRHCFFLDSSCSSKELGRYSFLGGEPFLKITSANREPFSELREALGTYRLKPARGGPPFLAGAVGYLAYDLGFLLEKKLFRSRQPDPGIPDAKFYFYNHSVIIDHFKDLLYICSTGFPEKKYFPAKALAKENFNKLHALISRACGQKEIKSKKKEKAGGFPRSNFTREGYFRAVEKAKDYISKGDIYQVNLSQRFEADSGSSAGEIYRRLRRQSPSAFAAFLDGGDFQIISSSPERFLALNSGRVLTRPMKGTRPRGSDSVQDRRFKKELLASPKDKAELVMIVDLERNDLGRVCEYDTVKVTRLRQLEKYKTVFQTTATIEGRLFPGKDSLDLLRACFPGGSITGCPKIRAMEIIDELEPHRRAVYTGSLGYLSFSGNMDFNILIRTILKKKNRLYFSVGAGIVADSDPLAEYQETLVKAKGMFEAILPRRQ